MSEEKSMQQPSALAAFREKEKLRLEALTPEERQREQEERRNRAEKHKKEKMNKIVEAEVNRRMAEILREERLRGVTAHPPQSHVRSPRVIVLPVQHRPHVSRRKREPSPQYSTMTDSDDDDDEYTEED